MNINNIRMADLRKSHPGYDREHDLLSLGRVRVLDVLAQPGLEGARRLACGVPTSYIESRHRAVTATSHASVASFSCDFSVLPVYQYCPRTVSSSLVGS